MVLSSVVIISLAKNKDSESESQIDDKSSDDDWKKVPAGLMAVGTGLVFAINKIELHYTSVNTNVSSL